MSENAYADWHEANQHYLMAAVDVVGQQLENHIAALNGSPAPPESLETAFQSLRAAEDNLQGTSALDAVCDLFALSAFEHDILVLCAGYELDASIAKLCAQIDPQRPYPTFGLVLSVFSHAHWSALTPNSPLRYWRLVEIGAGNALTLQQLRIDERILHYLTGISHHDQRLESYLEEVHVPEKLVPSHQVLADRIIRIWSRSDLSDQNTHIQLCDKNLLEKRSIAASACADLGMALYRMDARALPSNLEDLGELVRLWDREAILSGSALLLECEVERPETGNRQTAANKFIEATKSPLLISTIERRRILGRRVVTIDVEKPTTSEQQTLWEEVLDEGGAELNGSIKAITTQFDLESATIGAVYAEALSNLSNQDDEEEIDAKNLSAELWKTCCLQTRPRLDNLAQRIEPASSWDDLVLPEAQHQLLREVAAHVRNRIKVYDEWGFRAKGLRGLGISALFAGTSGTGKTMAAEVLANELNLDLYVIDLSQVVSKYIGETEKNLSRVFDAAEDGGAILLFDEADALFGKRSEVKDSHDRYANIEVSYLLQRMEAYHGLAILTTNMKKALDNAFVRRLRFIVQFPFPEAKARAEIWGRIFPIETPTKGLDVEKLSQLNIPGGNIRNIALNAAFLAADTNEPVQMAHLARAARSEYAKLEKTVTERELRGWA